MLIKDNLIQNKRLYNDLFLLRFMRARKFDITKVHEMFSNYLKWAKEIKLDQIEDFEYTELMSVKEIYPMGYHKTDK